MTGQEKTRWKNWADSLRQDMMSGLTAEVTRSVEAIASETATTKAGRTLRSVRFWQACQSGERPNEVLTKAGFEIKFEQDETSQVQEVTLQLNKGWMDIMQGAIDRNKLKQSKS